MSKDRLNIKNVFLYVVCLVECHKTETNKDSSKSNSNDVSNIEDETQYLSKLIGTWKYNSTII